MVKNEKTGEEELRRGGFGVSDERENAEREEALRAYIEEAQAREAAKLRIEPDAIDVPETDPDWLKYQEDLQKVEAEANADDGRNPEGKKEESFGQKYQKLLGEMFYAPDAYERMSAAGIGEIVPGKDGYLYAKDANGKFMSIGDILGNMYDAEQDDGTPDSVKESLLEEIALHPKGSEILDAGGVDKLVEHKNWDFSARDKKGRFMTPEYEDMLLELYDAEHPELSKGSNKVRGVAPEMDLQQFGKKGEYEGVTFEDGEEERLQKEWMELSPGKKIILVTEDPEMLGERMAAWVSGHKEEACENVWKLLSDEAKAEYREGKYKNTLLGEMAGRMWGHDAEAEPEKKSVWERMKEGTKRHWRRAVLGLLALGALGGGVESNNEKIDNPGDPVPVRPGVEAVEARVGVSRQVADEGMGVSVDGESVDTEVETANAEFELNPGDDYIASGFLTQDADGSYGYNKEKRTDHAVTVKEEFESDLQARQRINKLATNMPEFLAMSMAALPYGSEYRAHLGVGKMSMREMDKTMDSDIEFKNRAEAGWMNMMEYHARVEPGYVTGWYENHYIRAKDEKNIENDASKMEVARTKAQYFKDEPVWFLMLDDGSTIVYREGCINVLTPGKPKAPSEDPGVPVVKEEDPPEVSKTPDTPDVTDTPEVTPPPVVLDGKNTELDDPNVVKPNTEEQLTDSTTNQSVPSGEMPKTVEGEKKEPDAVVADKGGDTEAALAAQAAANAAAQAAAAQEGQG